MEVIQIYPADNYYWLLSMLALCITCFFVHGFLPDCMLSTVLVPIIKDKTGRIDRMDNYRPIALASVM